MKGGKWKVLETAEEKAVMQETEEVVWYVWWWGLVRFFCRHQRLFQCVLPLLIPRAVAPHDGAVFPACCWVSCKAPRQCSLSLSLPKAYEYHKHNLEVISIPCSYTHLCNQWRRFWIAKHKCSQAFTWPNHKNEAKNSQWQEPRRTDAPTSTFSKTKEWPLGACQRS